MKILITNDDGIRAPGIKHLVNSLKNYCELVVVAPLTEQSGVGLSITLRNPLHIEKHSIFEGVSSWSVSGTPADCVKLALNVILDEKPDLIVSGINRGTNAGRNVLYSGTVAAVIEGTMHDIPGIAFSSYCFHDPSYERLEPYIVPIVENMVKASLPKGTFLNVNFPRGPIHGAKVTSMGREYWAESPDMRLHPNGETNYFWLGGELRSYPENDPSDVKALNEGYITMTPVHVHDMTDYDFLTTLQKSGCEASIPSFHETEVKQ